MTPTNLLMYSTFSLSIFGLSMHRSHLVSALLCIEGMMLALFITSATLLSTTQTTSLAATPIILLTFSACEAGTGLALLVATARTHGNDHLQNLNLLQC
ncbi:NADH dehydrogenase subunit 4L (mitochondrion) [Anolis carolinensis]|uniref:NADH-ubiquinone oxidoreductase chain 4L n=1 Tax=Anolis carolinensis TaxID=28377 RepID=B3GSZ8_ANOCA|nr:NADH dehydrogenase subunit 4L [Anolis carolinensis]|eukprot:YP_001974678.1 NADH dehydrogenase subunit 4L (mitochondrion) [Anolis carolinensis]